MAKTIIPKTFAGNVTLLRDFVNAPFFQEVVITYKLGNSKQSVQTFAKTQPFLVLVQTLVTKHCSAVQQDPLGEVSVLLKRAIKMSARLFMINRLE